jgi:hypothetical protein
MRTADVPGGISTIVSVSGPNGENRTHPTATEADNRRKNVNSRNSAAPLPRFFWGFRFGLTIRLSIKPLLR